MDFRYVWTDGNDAVFQHFYRITEDYYNTLVGGENNRRSFMPYNLSAMVEGVLIVWFGEKPVACAGYKRYSKTDAEIKRVWVEPEYRCRHIAAEMMRMLEDRIVSEGFERAILQTRESMTAAVRLYLNLGYCRIENYPPYDKLGGAVCFAKQLK